MLKILVEKCEKFDDNTQEFITLSKDVELVLEHSLVSISKWESKWHKPFLIEEEKTNEELLDYVKCMVVSQNVPDEVYYFLSRQNMIDINKYVEDPMTATTFHTNSFSHNKPQNPYKKQETLTSEIIYYWMIENNIPMECQKWHLNRLLTLIRVCNIKHQNENNGNKMNKKDIAMNNRMLNEARRAKLGSKG